MSIYISLNALAFNFFVQFKNLSTVDFMKLTLTNSGNILVVLENPGKMRHFFKLGTFFLVILVSCASCLGAGRRRLSSRSPPYFQPPYPFQLRSTSPVSHRIPTTSQPYRYRPISTGIHNPFYNFGAASLNSASTELQPESNHRMRCKNAHEIFPDPNNPSLYKVCISIGHTWILYTYRCPNGTEFEEEAKKCKIVPVATATTAPLLPNSSTQPSPTTPVLDWTTSKTTHIVDGGSKIPEGNTTEIEMMPDNSMEGLESSSSSSEESSTNPSEMPTSVSSASTSIPSTTTTTPTPKSKPVSSFVQHLINHGIMQKPQKDRFALISKLLMSTTRPEWENMSIYKGQYKVTPTISQSITSLDERQVNQDRESDNGIWESLYKPTPTSTTTARTLLTRWKVVQDGLVPAEPQAGRFPGLRPSPMIT